jgi:hypothetical protein
MHLVEECKTLLPKVRQCADSADEINKLADRRRAIRPSQQLSAEEADKRREKITREIETLYNPWDGVKRKVQVFINKLIDALRAVPMDPPQLLAIRDEILPGCDAFAKHWLLSMHETHRFLQVAEVRLQDFLDVLRKPSQRNQQTSGTSECNTIVLPDDATWPDISIRFTSDHAFQVHVRAQPGPFRNYTEAGFEDAKTGNPVSSWKTLREIATQGGQIERPHSSPKSVSRLEKQIQDLRRRLRALFGLQDDPFFPYREVKCYRTKFEITAPKSTIH